LRKEALVHSRYVDCATQVNAWAFSTGVMTHVLLVAALRNPTIRRRYQTVRAVLEDYGHDALYPELLGFLGCADWTRAQTAHHLNAVIAMFDTAAALGTTRFSWSSDITPLARPILVEGSRELIERGHHRDAVFWIVATAALPVYPGRRWRRCRARSTRARVPGAGRRPGRPRHPRAAVPRRRRPRLPPAGLGRG